MSRRTVPYQHDLFIRAARVCFGKLAQKDFDAALIEPGQNQPKHSTARRVNRRIQPQPFVAGRNHRDWTLTAF